MATAKSTLSVVLPQAVPAVENPQVELVRLPTSYQEALSSGWYVTREKTPFVHGSGEIIMSNDEYSQPIRITYTTEHFGYQYSAPVIAE
jgi:hypothetical protein